MPKPPQAVVTKERHLYTYAELWKASESVLEHGINEPCGSSWQFLSSAVLTAFAFEAYLNHVGPTLISCWAELERLPPWAKFELICENLGVVFPEGPGKRPLQTVVKLLEFRNAIAHGRSQHLKPKPELRDLDERLNDYLGERPVANWERLIRNSDFAQRARQDVKAALEKIHAARPSTKELLFTFGLGVYSAVPAPP